VLKRLEERISELERENRWLRDLVMERGEKIEKEKKGRRTRGGRRREEEEEEEEENSQDGGKGEGSRREEEEEEEVGDSIEVLAGQES